MRTIRDIRPGAWLFVAVLAVAAAVLLPRLRHRERDAIPKPAPGVVAAAHQDSEAPVPVTPPTSGDVARTATGAPPRAGMVVGVNPETGELGLPSPEQARRLGEALAARPAAEEPLEVRLPDGSVGATLPHELRPHTLVRVASDGRLEATCVQGARAAQDFVADSLARKHPGPEER